MSRVTEDPVMVMGVVVGVILIGAGVGTLVTAPWQYYGSSAVTVLRILGTVGTILIGLGLLYFSWGMEWLDARNA